MVQQPTYATTHVSTSDSTATVIKAITFPGRRMLWLMMLLAYNISPMMPFSLIFNRPIRSPNPGSY